MKIETGTPPETGVYVCYLPGLEVPTVLRTFITETGWVDTRANHRWLTNYYLYATQNIWNDDRILGVTPFVLQGAPGPFEEFTFLDALGKPTQQYRAYQEAIKSLFPFF